MALSRRRIGVWLRVAAAAAASVLLLVGSYWLWYSALRGQPEPEARELFAGIEYERVVRSTPEPVVIHRVKVQLSTPGLRFFVTPPEPLDGHTLRGRTVGSFLERYDMRVAVNGDFFMPWHSSTPWDYYPKTGEPVDPLGFAASGGAVYMQGRKEAATLYVSCDNEPSFERPEDLCHAVSGGPLLSDGALALHDKEADRHPRTAAGLARDGNTLVLLVVDGRQPGYSVGMSLPDLGREMLESGAWDAINLDGGGSSTLAVRGARGQAEVLSSPIHTRIVGRQRPVANHFGIAGP